MMKKRMDFKRKVSKNLFTWIWKCQQTDKNDVETMVKYLISLEEDSKNFLLPEDSEWVHDLVINIKANNFEALDINPRENIKKEIMRLLYAGGLKSKEIGYVIGIIDGKYKVATAEKLNLEAV